MTCIHILVSISFQYAVASLQMVLEMVIPRYLDHLSRETTRRDSLSMARAEITAINNIAAAIRALINCSDYFTR